MDAQWRSACSIHVHDGTCISERVEKEQDLPPTYPTNPAGLYFLDMTTRPVSEHDHAVETPFTEAMCLHEQ